MDRKGPRVLLIIVQLRFLILNFCVRSLLDRFPLGKFIVEVICAESLLLLGALSSNDEIVLPGATSPGWA